jgi:hypothetical protein
VRRRRSKEDHETRSITKGGDRPAEQAGAERDGWRTTCPPGDLPPTGGNGAEQGERSRSRPKTPTIRITHGKNREAAGGKGEGGANNQSVRTGGATDGNGCITVTNRVNDRIKQCDKERITKSAGTTKGNN